MNNPIFSRKFIFAILVVVAGFVLVCVGRATADQWMTFTSVIGGIYVIGNVATKVVVPPQTNFDSTNNLSATKDGQPTVLQ